VSDCPTAGSSSFVRVPCPYKLSVRQHLGTSAVLSVRHHLGTYSLLCFQNSGPPAVRFDWGGFLQPVNTFAWPRLIPDSCPTSTVVLWLQITDKELGPHVLHPPLKKILTPRAHYFAWGLLSSFAFYFTSTTKTPQGQTSWWQVLAFLLHYILYHPRDSYPAH
jgi:hypothetical protein